MSIRLPQKTTNISPYDPSVPRHTIKLDANESYLPLKDEIRHEIADRSMDLAYHRYPDPASRELTEAAAAYYGVPPDAVAAGVGSDELISVLIKCFCESGQTVMTLSPDFSMYRFYAEADGLTVVDVEKGEDFSFTAAKVIEKAREIQPQLLIFSNPCNPTGQGIAAEEALNICAALPDVLTVVDEAYMDFWNESVLPASLALDHVLVLKTMSKAFGLAALRVGFVIGHKTLIDWIHRMRSPYNLNAYSQMAAGVVLGNEKWLQDSVRKIVSQKELMEDELSWLADQMEDRFSIQKTKTNFVVIKTAEAEAIHQKLIDAGIVVRCFGRHGFLRVTAGTPNENFLFIEAFARILEELS